MLQKIADLSCTEWKLGPDLALQHKLLAITFKMVLFRSTTKHLIWSIVLYSLARVSAAKSILGFASIGATSHQAVLARIGLELRERGHDFAMLVSSEDALTLARFAQDPFKDLRQIVWSGPAEIGSNQFLNKIPRDPAKVYTYVATVAHFSQAYA